MNRNVAALVLSVAVAAAFTACGQAQPGAGSDAATVGSEPILTTIEGAAPPPPLPFDDQELPGCDASAPAQGTTVPWLPGPVVAPVVTPEVKPAQMFICPDDQVVIIRYPSSSAFGAFWLREYPPPSPDFGEADIQYLAGVCRGCTENKIVQLLPTVDGALMAGKPGDTSVSWFQKGVYLSVIGPGDTFTSADAQAVAAAAAAAELALPKQ